MRAAYIYIYLCISMFTGICLCICPIMFINTYDISRVLGEVGAMHVLSLVLLYLYV